MQWTVHPPSEKPLKVLSQSVRQWLILSNGIGQKMMFHNRYLQKKINTRNGIAEVTAFWIDERHDQQQNCRQKVMTTHSKHRIGNRLDNPEVQGSLTAL